jgi:uncharacterized protein YcbX
VACEESLADLNTRLPAPIPMARFRPNLVVAGAGGPFAEDAWGRIRVGGGGDSDEAAAASVGAAAGALEMAVVRPCDRCAVPSVDQELGVKREPNPLDTLNRFR